MVTLQVYMCDITVNVTSFTNIADVVRIMTKVMISLAE
jgi:hypothetical protein